MNIPKAESRIHEILDSDEQNWTFTCHHVRETDGLCNEMCNGFCKEFRNLVKQLSDDKIEFAKLHVKEALNKASEDANIKDVGAINGEGEYVSYEIIDKQSILDAYPDELIK